MCWFTNKNLLIWVFSGIRLYWSHQQLLVLIFKNKLEINNNWFSVPNPVCTSLMKQPNMRAVPVLFLKMVSVCHAGQRTTGGEVRISVPWRLVSFPGTRSRQLQVSLPTTLAVHWRTASFTQAMETLILSAAGAFLTGSMSESLKYYLT